MRSVTMHSSAQNDFAALLESRLRDDLMKCDGALQSSTPILRHLLDGSSNSLFSQDIIASVRGMAQDVARQLHTALVQAGVSFESDEVDQFQAKLLGAISASPQFLRHLHALAIEWQLTNRLNASQSLDTILSPLFQQLLASTDPAVSGIAMHALAAQARFCQAQRRMQLALNELPSELFDHALQAMNQVAGHKLEGQAASIVAGLHSQFDESKSRIGLISLLLVAMGGTAMTALSVSHAGVAFFTTALAMAAKQDRDQIILATDDSQLVRFALALRASGLKQLQVEGQIQSLFPHRALPESFEQITPDQAAAIIMAAGQGGAR